MAADVVPYFRPQFLDLNGRPLDGGKVYTYKAGTTTPLVTYRDAAFTQNTNPIILDSSGCADIFIGIQPVKFVIHDKNDVLIKTVDTVTGASGASVGIQTVVPITTDGVETTFALGVEPEVPQNCTVVVQPTSGDRIVYMTSEFSVDGQDLIFDIAPPAGTGEIRIGHTRAIGSSGLSDGIVSTSKLQDNAVTNSKIADDAISTSKIQNESVTEPKLADSAVSNRALADDSVSNEKIQDGTIDHTKFAVLPNLKSQTFTANGSWTAPAGVTQALLLGCGGGGGGGGGGGILAAGSNSGSAGGGGGAGSNPTLVAVPVTAGASYTVTIGSGGAGGAGISSNGTNRGATGSTGGTTTFGSLARFFGGGGGTGGTADGTSGGTGGSTGAGVGFFSSGGSGGVGTTGTSGTAGSAAQIGGGGAGGAGAGSTAGGGGGGGGGGYGTGGAGGAGAANGNGSPGATGGYGAGGGGGGGADDGVKTGGTGGTGGAGIVIVYWVENQ